MGGRLSLFIALAAALVAFGCKNPLMDKVTNLVSEKNQKISVSAGSTVLSSGGSVNFGSTAIGVPKDMTFTIQNTGNSALNFTGSAPVQGSGEFSALTQPTGPVAPGSSTSFILRFLPAAPEGIRNATIKINSNDPNQGAFTFTAKGFASTVVLPKTGQTISYAAGDDGNIQKGATLAGTRFLSGSSVVTDALTGLQWTMNASLLATTYLTWDPDATPGDGKVNWQNALAFVAYLNSISYGGYTDWRLPNRDEQRSLINHGQANVAAWLNAAAQGFLNANANYYWTSTTDASNTANAWALDMSTGRVVSRSKTLESYVWPVRTAPSAGLARLRATGQASMYVSKDDGDLKAGVAWPSPRFINNGDGTVTDKLTGLMWRNASPAASSWSGCYALAAGDQTAGYSDWRLPNVVELDSLLNAGSSDSTAYLNAQGLDKITNANYWTSTTNASATGEAWYIQLGTGAIDTWGAGSQSVILVRDAL